MTIFFNPNSLLFSKSDVANGSTSLDTPHNGGARPSFSEQFSMSLHGTSPLLQL